MRQTWQRAWNGPIVAIAVAALIVILALPAVQQAREAARRTQSKNNLKQIGLGLDNYYDAFRMFPPNGVFGSDGKPL